MKKAPAGSRHARRRRGSGLCAHAGAVRITETELELMALAEAVQELEAAFKKERAKSSSLREALDSPTGKRNMEAPRLAEICSPEAALLTLPDPRH